jgi:4-amino-4-deoxy-L-arabinose transferase-like glycosyltransferase
LRDNAHAARCLSPAHLFAAEILCVLRARSLGGRRALESPRRFASCCSAQRGCSFTLVGHDPWKPDEAYTFGIVLDFLERGDWVVPTLAGEPFLEKPPLFFITASLFARAFGGLLPLHDAARLASGFYVALALLFLALTAREIHGRRHGWTAVLIMLGCLGVIVRAHQLITDVALLAGISIGVYGLAIGRRFSIRGGFALGAGIAIAFLSEGIAGPGNAMANGDLAPLSCQWRQRIYFRTLVHLRGCCAAANCSLDNDLYLRSPDLFTTGSLSTTSTGFSV